MSYLVLARKSRPQTFDQVVGQRSVVKTLQNSLIRNRVAHAILFSGVRGVGKTTLARLMAKAINCQETESTRPCDKCISCREIAAGASLDLHEIDGASNRGIQEIRELKEKIRFLPTSSPYKIIIIDEVHMLTTEAFNALLKTLEEPPGHVYFMFATTEIHKIPVTILSRCQQYELKRISAEELYDHFDKLTKSEGFEIEPAALSLIVREAGGSVRDGLSLLDQMFSFGEKTIATQDVIEVLGLVDREVLMQLTRGLLDQKHTDVLQALQQIFDYGLDIKRFLVDLMGHFRSLLLCKIDGCTNLIELPAEELVEFQKLAEKYSPETLHQKLNLLMTTAEKIRHSNQPRLTLETSFLSIIEAGNVADVSMLLGKLDEVLQGLPDQTITSASEPASIPAPAITPTKSESTKESLPKIACENTHLENPPTDTSEPPPSEKTTISSVENTENTPSIAIKPHAKDVRKDWLDFIAYVKNRKVWMAQDLQRADTIKQEKEELHLTYSDPANCAVLRQQINQKLLAEFTLDFFQKPLKVCFIVPEVDDSSEGSNTELSPHRKRQELANDPLVIMTAEVFNGQVGDIRVGPNSR